MDKVQEAKHGTAVKRERARHESPILHHYKQRPILKSVFLFVELSIYNPFNGSKITFYKELRSKLIDLVQQTLHPTCCKLASFLFTRFKIIMNAVGKIDKTNYIKTCCTILKPIKSMTKSSYDTMTMQAKESLCSATPKRMVELAKSACCLAEKIKTYFDSKYGDKNYTIISIGRSMAAISEIMQDLGSNVNFIPLSEMKMDNEFTSESINVFKNYLESVGLNKEKIERKLQHKYIFFDYAYSGKSLLNATKLLTNNNLLGEHPNIESVESNKFLGNFYKLFSYSRFKEFSPIGKLPLGSLEEVFKQSSPDTAKEYNSDMAKIIRKLFRFHIFNCLKTKDYHIEKPSLELNALARYETQKFLKYKLNSIDWNIFSSS